MYKINNFTILQFAPPSHSFLPMIPTICCKGNIIDFATPRVMGILNITPDSFYDGGRYTSDKLLLAQAEKMLDEGADFIDIGAMSSRPGAEELAEDAELSRLLPAVRALVRHFPQAVLSADTYRAAVARAAVQEGVQIINDISGGLFDPKLPAAIAQMGVPYIIMHLQGTPQTMQQNPQYDDVVRTVYNSLVQRAQNYREMGVKDIIIDPGFGFGKTIAHNYLLLQHLDRFALTGLPLMVGLSRKSMIYKALDTTPDQALNGTSVLHTIALLKGAHLLRVHDVAPAKEAIKLTGLRK